MKTKTVLLMSLLFSHALAFAHGEDKPGPHGGYIRMPGAFHTELVPDGQNQFKVYLLDLHWKNPTVAHSSLKVTHQGKGATEAKCEAQKSFFLCRFEKGADLTRGRLVVEARREKQVGGLVTYDLPLHLGAPSSTEHEHGEKK